MSSSLSSFLRETARLSYWFWFKPITLNRHMKEVAGEVDLDSSLLRPRAWKGLLGNRDLLRLFAQLALGALVCLVVGCVLAEAIRSLVLAQPYITRNVAVGVAIGVAVGVAASVAGGVAGGVVGGVAGGMAYGVAIGAAVGVVYGVAVDVVNTMWSDRSMDGIEAFAGVRMAVHRGVWPFSVAAGAAIGAAIGVMDGKVRSVVGSLAGCLLVLVSINLAQSGTSHDERLLYELRFAFSWAEAFYTYGDRSDWDSFVALEVGAVSFVAFGATLTRLYLLPLWWPWSLFQWALARSAPNYAKHAFDHCPLQYDELIYAPLPSFDRFVGRCIQVDPDRRDAVLVQVSNSTGQKWAARRAVVQLLFDDLLKVKSLDEMAAQAQSIRAVLDTAAEQARQRLLRPDQVALLARFEQMAEELSVTTGEDSKYLAIQRLNLARQSLKNLLNAAALSRQPQFTQVARHWQELVDRHEQGLTAQRHDERLPNVFSAGNALSPDAPSFRGRADVFAAIEEVSANPRRGEPLLLFGQPRMGKSSVLQQLPVRLANTLSLYVDSQDALNVQSTAGYVSSLTKAIALCDGVRRRGLRPQTLTLEQTRSEPLLGLNDWLNDLARSVSGRRVLLCFDEFEKIAAKVADGAISPDALDQLRGLSQRPGWLVLFSGTHELDELSAQFANQFNNARRVKVSYLDEASARDLIEQPEPDYPQWCEPAAVDKIIALTRCQPFLVQAVCASLVRYLNEHKRFVATAEDVQAALPSVFSDYRNYFISIEQSLAPEDRAALDAVAHGSALPNTPRAIQRLIERDYIEADGEGSYRFEVLLMREWWARRTST